jgi:hypothetical protein
MMPTKGGGDLIGVGGRGSKIDVLERGTCWNGKLHSTIHRGGYGEAHQQQDRRREVKSIPVPWF